MRTQATLSPEDVSLREGRITSTRIAKIAGLSDWGGQNEAYLDILGLREIPDSRKMRMGRFLQPAIGAARLDALNEQEGTDRYRLVEIPTLVHPDHPWAASSFDYGVSEGESIAWLLEVKNAGWRMAHKWGDEGTDAVPMDYLLQCHWEAAIASAALGIDLPFTELVAFIGGEEDRVYRIPRDKEMEARLLDIGARFHRDHVVPRVPPPVDGSDACRQLLQEQFPQLRPTMVEAGEEDEAWAERLRAAKEARRAADAEQRLAENHLLEAMAGARGIEGDGWRCQVVEVAAGMVEAYERKAYRRIDFREKKGRN